ncbi:MAG TPA: hypothetical protein VMP01_30005 [Pirellulaceae bacterium]|nr:hypothetical protein [Pirellulaceae bacterium]
MRTKVECTLGLLASAMSVAAFGQEDEYPIKPHPESQRLLELWAEPTDIKEHYALLAQIVPLASDDYRRFVQQVYYFVHHLEKDDAGEKGMVAGSLFRICAIPESAVATALVPYLYGQHAALRKAAWQLFRYTLGQDSESGCCDLTHIISAIRNEGPEIADPLKRAIFEVAPHSAFRVYLNSMQEMEGLDLLRAHQTLESALFALRVNKTLALKAGERSVDKNGASSPKHWTADIRSIGALRELATSKHWWARMFASEFMVHNKEFRVDELIDKLAQDENDLVRQSAASIKTPDPLRAPVGPLRP